MQVALEKIVVKPGQQLLLRDISWSDFEEILADLGEHRGSRISYRLINGLVESRGVIKLRPSLLDLGVRFSPH
jgi:hypothetical protein